jgi:glycine/D-amino acid oxidase-like deaminating enzyme
MRPASTSGLAGESREMQKSRLGPSRYQVIVVGAGSAGCAAAFASATAGASTLLVERLGFCGGTPVAAGIHTLDAIRSCRDYSRTVVGGFASELIEVARQLGGSATADNPPEALALNPEYMKVAYDRLLQRAGVDTLFHALAMDTMVEDQRVLGVEVALLDGRALVEADVVVDCTGDAAVVYQCGAEWIMDDALQALTYHFRLGNVQPGRDWEWLENACRNAVEKSAPNGFIYGGPWIIRLNEREISLNSTRAFGNPVDPSERSRAEQQTRADMLRLVDILRREVPELKDSYLTAGATDLHVRESRKLVGAYTLTEEDIATNRVFSDAVAYGAWPFDIHPTDGFVGVHPHKENPPEPYGIPYRCLVPRKMDGLLVAGKAISTTHVAHGSTRVPGTSMATGQAAGVAAALSSRNRLQPREISIDALRSELLRQAAILPPAEPGGA